MTPTTVRMVLVEGEKADGVTVDHDAFEVSGADGSATSSAAEQVVAAVQGTQESATASGHHLKSIGVTWTHHADAAALRDALAARGIEDVMLVSATHAASSLAQAVGRAIGHDTTGLLFIEKDTATLSVVKTEDGSVVKVLSRDLHDSDAMAVFTEMAQSVESAESAPQSLFVVGSGVDAAAVKTHLENLVALPVSAPEEPELALARGAALASAHAPEMEASTAGLAYSQDPDGTTAASAYPESAAAATQLAGVATQVAPARAAAAYSDPLAYSDEIPESEAEAEPFADEESRKPFLLVGSALTSIFVVGVIALVISLAVNIRPTADQRPGPGQTPVIPSQAAPAPIKDLAPAAPAPAPAAAVPAPPPETIKAPIPVVQQAPVQAPRTVFVEQPAPPAAVPAPAPAASAPVPDAPIPAPLPAAPVDPIPAAPPIYNPPAYNPYYPQRPAYVAPRQSWAPPWRQSQQVPDEPQSPQYPGSGGYPGSGSYPGSGGYPGSGAYPGSGSSDYGRGGYGGGGSRSGSGPSICVFGICTGGH